MLPPASTPSVARRRTLDHRLRGAARWEVTAASLRTGGRVAVVIAAAFVLGLLLRRRRRLARGREAVLLLLDLALADFALALRSRFLSRRRPLDAFLRAPAGDARSRPLLRRCVASCRLRRTPSFAMRSLAVPGSVRHISDAIGCCTALPTTASLAAVAAVRGAPRRSVGRVPVAEAQGGRDGG